MKKLSIIFTLLLVLGGKASAQYEFEYVFDSIKDGSKAESGKWVKE
ncbi:MAG: hypothetical protein MJ000_07140 [Bacteroidales bacterium]|nr:hypothetical protein [Bacteroidales bacterium]